MLNSTFQRLCAWSGIVLMLMFFGAFLYAHFLPPPGPYLTQDEVVAIYQRDANDIRIGFVLMMIGGMFMSPFAGVISFHIRRIDCHVSRLLAYTQLSAGTIGMLTTFIPAVMFMITAYRPERAPELTYLMNDMSWFLTVIIWPPFLMQNVAIAAAVFMDKRLNPIFPRWFGYFQLWVALGYVGATLLPFFKSGPFAWNGLFAFWLPAIVFGPWFVVTAVMVIKAINREEQETLVSEHSTT